MAVPSVPLINRQPRSSDGTLELAWNPPVSDGGSSITAYGIGIYGDPGYSGAILTTGTDGTARYIKIQRPDIISNGTNLYITIAAVNATGTGPVAKFRAPWQTGNKPGAPASINVTNLGAGAYTVSWTAPVSDGGATIFWYVITILTNNIFSTEPPQRISVSGNTRSKTIQGLNPTTVYSFVVQAVNCPGYSPGIANEFVPIQLLRGSSYISGTTWPKTEFGDDATLVDGLAIPAGDPQNSLELNGSTSWEFPLGRELNRFTVNAWFKNTVPPIQDPNISPAIIAQIFPGIGGVINFMITTNINEKVPAGYFACGFYDEGYYFGTPFILPLNAWINIQFTWNGTNITTYINGNSIGNVYSPRSPRGSTQNIRIGKRWDGEQFMTGLIGEVRLYDVALVAEQVLADYNESAPNFL
jgi:hypothetical protein